VNPTPAARADLVAADIVRSTRARNRRRGLRTGASNVEDACLPAAERSGERMKLLLVEPDTSLSAEYKRMLDAAGFDVEVGSGAHENGAVPAYFPVVMIGARTPPGERATLLRRLQRGAAAAPSLVLAAGNGEDATLRNAPPRDRLEQEFQIDALVRRLQSLLAPPRPLRGFARRFGNVSIDGDGQVVIGGEVAYLQPTEVLVLSLLMRRKGKILPKRSIETSLYGRSDETTANAVEVRVHRLRKSLAATAADLSIRTIRNAGYFLERRGPAN
jgi:DNA-binding response OmpR family regulator